MQLASDVIHQVKRQRNNLCGAGNMVPCLGIKIMSDEKYKELTMKKREQRIFEIMDEKGVDWDVAEQLFLDELEEAYPDSDRDVRETLYELDNET